MELINTIILYIMMIFMLIGAFGRILKQWNHTDLLFAKFGQNKLYQALIGAGDEFENGFMTMGTLGLAMVGVIALAPVIAKLLGPLIIPLYNFTGASPAMFATTLLANDMGGYFLAKELATENGVVDNASWLFSGLILGSMLGATIVFSIPVALGIIDFKDRKFLALGVLAGIITIPIGCLAGGIVAMYSNIMVDQVPVVFTLRMILVNLIPVVIVAILIILGLWMFPEKMINGFQVFAKILVTIITIGLAAAVFSTILGIQLIPGIDPIFMVPGDTPGQVIRAMEVIGYIACILMGAYPLVFLMTLLFKTQLIRLGSILHINNFAAAGLIASLANNIPMFCMMNKMDDRGKLLNVAFAVSAAFTFGDHLGFTAANSPGMIFAVITGKLVGGLTALIVALFIAPAAEEKQEIATSE